MITSRLNLTCTIFTQGSFRSYVVVGNFSNLMHFMNAEQINIFYCIYACELSRSASDTRA